MSVQNQHYNQGNSRLSDIPIPLIEDRIVLSAEERQRERILRNVGRDRKLGSQRANRTDRHTTQRERADKHTHTLDTRMKVTVIVRETARGSVQGQGRMNTDNLSLSGR